MSRIRSKDTRIELLLAKALRAAKIRYRRHPAVLGTPDFLVFSGKHKALVFVDGDFWHGWDYERRKKRLPPFWREKIKRNMSRDVKQRGVLRKKGWKVLRVWEHQILASPEKCAAMAAAILD